MALDIDCPNAPNVLLKKSPIPPMMSPIQSNIQSPPPVREAGAGQSVTLTARLSQFLLNIVHAICSVTKKIVTETSLSLDFFTKKSDNIFSWRLTSKRHVAVQVNPLTKKIDTLLTSG